MDLSKVDPAVLAQLPALEPPPGVEPNFSNPYSITEQPKIVTYILVPIMLIHVLLRYYTRIFVNRSFRIDDYVCGFSAAILISLCIISFQVLGDPLGPHQWNVRLIDITDKAPKYATIVYALYCVSTLAIKISILLLYRRLFWPKDGARHMIWIGMPVIVIFYLTNFIVILAQCTPRGGETWRSLTVQARCSQPQLRLSVAQGVFGVVSDVYLLVIPMLQVASLRVSFSQKIGLAGVFLTGLTACACSTLVCVFRFRQYGSADFTYMSVPPIAFGIAELNVGIICSCMPVIFVVIKRVSTKINSTIRSIAYSRGSRQRSGDDPSADFVPLGEITVSSSHQLPAISKGKGNLRTLRSFLGIGNPTNLSDSMDDKVELTNMSVDRDEDLYHAHMKAGPRDKH